MKNIKLILILVSILFQSCENKDCGECFTPPQSFSFEIVDKTSGENLFTNGTYEIGDLEITDSLNNNEPMEFEFISEDDMNLIYISSFGWETQIMDLKIAISEDHIFGFYVDAKRKTGDCCSYTEYDEITITDSEFELDAQTGIYKIRVE